MKNIQSSEHHTSTSGSSYNIDLSPFPTFTKKVDKTVLFFKTRGDANKIVYTEYFQATYHGSCVYALLWVQYNRVTSTTLDHSNFTNKSSQNLS